MDHHDKAYEWAERRKLETHAKTGAAQWVEIRETVQEIIIPKFVDALAPVAAKKPLFGQLSEAILELLAEASKEAGNHKFSLYFLQTEWEHLDAPACFTSTKQKPA